MSAYVHRLAGTPPADVRNTYKEPFPLATHFYKMLLKVDNLLETVKIISFKEMKFWFQRNDITIFLKENDFRLDR